MLNKIHTLEELRRFVEIFARQNDGMSDYRFDSSDSEQVMLI